MATVKPSAPMMELGTSRNEYVTRLSDYEELRDLLDYLSLEKGEAFQDSPWS